MGKNMTLESDDFNRRKEEFLEGYGKLVEEFRCDFLTRPMFAPSNDASRSWQFVFDTQVVDTTNMSVPSPLQI